MGAEPGKHWLGRDRGLRTAMHEASPCPPGVEACCRGASGTWVAGEAGPGRICSAVSPATDGDSGQAADQAHDLGAV